MKSISCLAVMISGLTLATTWAVAAPGANSMPGENREQRMISFLPADQQTEVMDAYKKAISSSPALQAEEADFRANHPDFATASPADRQAFMEKVRAHQEKLRTAMLKQDPKIEPMLEKIEEHRREMRQQREQPATTGAATSPASATAPASN